MERWKRGCLSSGLWCTSSQGEGVSQTSLSLWSFFETKVTNEAIKHFDELMGTPGGVQRVQDILEMADAPEGCFWITDVEELPSKRELQKRAVIAAYLKAKALQETPEGCFWITDVEELPKLETFPPTIIKGNGVQLVEVSWARLESPGCIRIWDVSELPESR